MSLDLYNHINCPHCHQPFEPTWTAPNHCGNCTPDRLIQRKVEELAVFEDKLKHQKLLLATDEVQDNLGLYEETQLEIDRLEYWVKALPREIKFMRN